MTFTFTRKEEHERVWRYADPFVGYDDLRKVELPDPPPEHVRVTVDWDN
jgi:hypothetical protein